MTDEQRRKLADAIDTLVESEAFEADAEAANFHSLFEHLEGFKKDLAAGQFDGFDT